MIEWFDWFEWLLRTQVFYGEVDDCDYTVADYVGFGWGAGYGGDLIQLLLLIRDDETGHCNQTFCISIIL